MEIEAGFYRKINTTLLVCDAIGKVRRFQRPIGSCSVLMVKYLRTGILDLLVSAVIRSDSVNGLTCKCRIPNGSRS